MAAPGSSVWANKPGTWALDAEEHDEELQREMQQLELKSSKPVIPPTEFPALSAAATTKTKKKKPQTVSLADFNKGISFNAQPKGLTAVELLSLPTGPRPRSGDEEEGSNRLGGGFRSYGGGYNRSESGNVRSKVSDRGEGYSAISGRGGDRDTGFSRADEADDWSKTKKSPGFGFGGSSGGPGGPGGSERRERGGFFNASRADEVDNWGSNKSFAPSSEGRRDRRTMGFDSYGSGGGGADSDSWGRRKEERDGGGFESRRFDRDGGGFERERRKYDFSPVAGAADADTWLRKKEERAPAPAPSPAYGGRPRLNLQPRTIPVSPDTNVTQPKGEEVRPKSSNPFGAARPREEVLAEKGKDWKELDAKLEAMKLKEKEELIAVTKDEDGVAFPTRRGFGLGRYDSGNDRVERTWRRPVTPVYNDAAAARPATAPADSKGSAAAAAVDILSVEKAGSEVGEQN